MIIPISRPAPVSMEEITAVAQMRTAILKMTLIYNERCDSLQRRLMQGARIERGEPPAELVAIKQ